MKKLVSLLCVIIIAFSCFACTKNNNNGLNSSTSASSQSTSISSSESKESSSSTPSSSIISSSSNSSTSSQNSSSSTMVPSSSSSSIISSNSSSSSSSSGNQGSETEDLSAYLVKDSTVPFKIHYDEEAPFINEGNSEATGTTGHDDGWQGWSLPIGNGYFGVNVFGRTESERVQITDKTLSNAWQAEIAELGWPQIGGLNNFSETYLDFNHDNNNATNYTRYLDLETAISGVEYTYNGVNYSREYFTSYPDKALVIRLDADSNGALSFVLRPTVPYEQEYMKYPEDGFGKYGEVVSYLKDGVGRIDLTGKMTYYDVDFVAYYNVYINGGTMSATTCTNAKGETDGTITVSKANSAYIVVTLGSDYELNTETFMTGQHHQQKPTANTTLDDAKAKVNGYLSDINVGINGKSYEDSYLYLKNRHLADYQSLYGRVNLDINCSQQDMDMSTNDLLAKYRTGVGSTYLEALLLQYGRYLLISSSRKGTLPAHLQGAWNCYNYPAWSSGYWNNVNIQMNYWHAFSTNIAETFESYVDYLDTFIVGARKYANDIIWTYNNGVFGQDGGNGWTVGTASNPYFIMGDRNCGNAGFTTQLYWDYYQFTKDPEVLQKVYEIMLDAARFITKCVKEYDGYYLVEYSDSPEMHVDGIWYYTNGTTYAQTLAYLNNYSVLQLAKELGIDITDASVLSQSDKTILNTILNQIDKYDPINVGLSGQIKEYRLEDYYGSIGHEEIHRHLSQLVGLFPGNLINSDTEAWLDAAAVSLAGRSEGIQDWHQAYTVGWSWAHKAALFARLGEGDKAQEMLVGLSNGATLDNLLMVCFKVFQIEASCGTSAALAEMLLQSQDTYISPLPAIPTNWQSGSYKGLVARGNFEVSAAWENGLATSFNILSKKGENLSIKYPSITEAKVYTSKGVLVNYNIVGQDIISFDTQEGETYIIYGFKKVETPNKVTLFEYESVGYGEFNFAWEKVEGAVSYNVYIAIENAPKYTLLGNVTNNGFKYTMPQGKENVRTTFAVTAINASGRESARTLVYYNPIDTTPVIKSVEWELLTNNSLQVVAKSNDVVVNYVLWEKAQGATTFTKVAESNTNTIIAQNYNATSVYGVSGVSVTGVASDKYIIANGSKIDNILLGKQFIPTEASYNSVYGITWDNNWGFQNLTDGVNYTSNSGRYSSTSESSAVMDSTIDLGASYILDEIRIYDYQESGKNIGSYLGTILEVYTVSNGVWTKVASIENSNLLTYRVYDNGNSWIAINLSGQKAEKIRINIPSILSSGLTISIYEIECSGSLDAQLRGEFTQNVFEGKQFIPTPETANMVNNNSMAYPALTDGVIYKEGAGRFATTWQGKVDGTLDLNGIYQLTEFKLYLFQGDIGQVGTKLQIQIYYNGVWTTALEIANADLYKYRVADPTADFMHYQGRTDYCQYLLFDLNYSLAEQVRIYIPSCTSSNWISFYELACAGVYIGENKLEENIFADKQFIPTTQALQNVLVESWWQGGGYEALTDGVRKEDQIGRFSTIMDINAMMDATLDLGGVYQLYHLKFYVYDGWDNKGLEGSGKDLLIQLYYNGEWTNVVSCTNNTEMGNYYIATSTEWFDDYLLFNLNGAKAEKIRFYISGATQSSGITFQEISCSGVYLEEASGLQNVFNGKQFVPTEQALADVINSSSVKCGGYEDLTDGIRTEDQEGRFSTRFSTDVVVDATLDLDGVCQLYELKFYIYDSDGLKGVGNNLLIQVYSNEEWVTVINCQDNSSLGDYLVVPSAQKYDDYLSFNLNGVSAEKVSIAINGATWSWGITFHEIVCLGKVA